MVAPPDTVRRLPWRILTWLSYRVPVVMAAVVTAMGSRGFGIPWLWMAGFRVPWVWVPVVMAARGFGIPWLIGMGWDGPSV